MALSTQEYIAIVAVFYTENIAENAVRRKRANEVSLGFFKPRPKVPLVEKFQVAQLFGLWVGKKLLFKRT